MVYSFGHDGPNQDRSKSVFNKSGKTISDLFRYMTIMNNKWTEFQHYLVNIDSSI